MPSPRPMKPSLSLVVALTPTRPASIPAISAIARAHRVAMRRRSSAPRRRCVTSRWTMRPPRAATRRTASARNRSEEAPFHCGSDGGKCSPISPSAIAPRIASVRAWSATSASEWPTRPRSCGIATPQSQTASPGAEGVHVEALCRCGSPDACPEQPLGREEILRIGELDVAADRPATVATAMPASAATAASSVKP